MYIILSKAHSINGVQAPRPIDSRKLRQTVCSFRQTIAAVGCVCGDAQQGGGGGGEEGGGGGGGGGGWGLCTVYQPDNYKQGKP